MAMPSRRNLHSPQQNPMIPVISSGSSNRPESRCSQQSTSSVTSGNALGTPKASRTTTSRRGGRASSSRRQTPVSFSKMNSNHNKFISPEGRKIVVQPQRNGGGAELMTKVEENLPRSNGHRDGKPPTTLHIPIPPSEENVMVKNEGPSSAAAAAAAAAKAFCGQGMNHLGREKMSMLSYNSNQNATNDNRIWPRVEVSKRSDLSNFENKRNSSSTTTKNHTAMKYGGNSAQAEANLRHNNQLQPKLSNSYMKMEGQMGSGLSHDRNQTRGDEFAIDFDSNSSMDQSGHSHGGAHRSIIDPFQHNFREHKRSLDQKFDNTQGTSISSQDSGRHFSDTALNGNYENGDNGRPRKIHCREMSLQDHRQIHNMNASNSRGAGNNSYIGNRPIIKYGRPGNKASMENKVLQGDTSSQISLHLTRSESFPPYNSVPSTTDVVQHSSLKPSNAPSSVFRNRSTSSNNKLDKERKGNSDMNKSVAHGQSNNKKSHMNSLSKIPQDPLSPKAPPQIQHSHQSSPNPLFFEPQQNTTKLPHNPSLQVSNSNISQKRNNSFGIEGTHSFSLFNQSFDSLNDAAPYLQQNSNVSGGHLIDSATFQSQSFTQVPSIEENNSLRKQPSFSFSRTGSILPPSMSGGYESFQQETKNNSSKNILVRSHSPDGMMAIEGVPISATDSFERSIIPLREDQIRREGSLPFSDKRSQTRRNLKQNQIHSPERCNIPFHRKSSNCRSAALGSQIPSYTEDHNFSSTVTSKPSMHSYRREGDGKIRNDHDIQGTISPYIIKSQIADPDVSLTTDAESPSFYQILFRHHKAFKQCNFLLPGLKIAMLKEGSISDRNLMSSTKRNGSLLKIERQQVDSKENNKNYHLKNSKSAENEKAESNGEYNLPSNIEIACRRVKSAICAFGGNFSSKNNNNKLQKVTSTQSIFREKKTSKKPSKGGEELGNVRGNEGKVVSNFYENENRLSWEVEIVPHSSMPREKGSNKKKINNDRFKMDPSKSSGGNDTQKSKDVVDIDGISRSDDEPLKKEWNSESEVHEKAVLKNMQDEDEIGAYDKDKECNSEGGDQPKMKYRCKLCGQPKQNHTCPYQQSLQRSIGVNVYSALNAFTAREPGCLAPALAEMNNFISGSDASSAESTPSRPTPDRSVIHTALPVTMVMKSHADPTNVTPETLRSGMSQNNPHQSTVHSPGSTLSALSSGTPFRTPYRKNSISATPGRLLMKGRIGQPGPLASSSLRRKRMSLDQDSRGDSSSDYLFIQASELRPEQYRIVSVSAEQSNDTFNYPSLPLPYAQRKRLSDNLFSLSKEVPQLTDECAVVLREARRMEMWDVAVAELLAQVIVVMYCHDDDLRLEGLSQYLSSLGFSC